MTSRLTLAALPALMVCAAMPSVAEARAIPGAGGFRLQPSHRQPTQPDRPQTLSVDDKATAPLARSSLSGLPASPFRDRLRANVDHAKIKTLSAEWDGGGLAFDVLRTKSTSRYDGQRTLDFNRFSAAELDAGIVQSIGANDTIALGGSYVLERWRPSLFVNAHNIFSTKSTSVGATWVHDDRLSFNLSAFQIGSGRVRSDVERLVELAGGAAPAAHGLSFSGQISPSGHSDRLSFGFDLRRQRYADGDAGRIGALPGTSDTRLALVLRRAF